MPKAGKSHGGGRYTDRGSSSGSGRYHPYRARQDARGNGVENRRDNRYTGGDRFERIKGRTGGGGEGGGGGGGGDRGNTGGGGGGGNSRGWASGAGAPSRPGNPSQPSFSRGAGFADRETDPKRLEKRQKQVDFGKNTIGYERYVCALPKRSRRRNPSDLAPRTPDVGMKCSKRRFDGILRAWRRALHLWDDGIPDGIDMTTVNKEALQKMGGVGVGVGGGGGADAPAQAAVEVDAAVVQKIALKEKEKEAAATAKSEDQSAAAATAQASAAATAAAAAAAAEADEEDDIFAGLDLSDGDGDDGDGIESDDDLL